MDIFNGLTYLLAIMFTFFSRQPKNDYDEVVRNRDTGPESEDMFLMKGYQWSEGKKSQYGGNRHRENHSSSCVLIR